MLSCCDLCILSVSRSDYNYWQPVTGNDPSLYKS